MTSSNTPLIIDNDKTRVYMLLFIIFFLAHFLVESPGSYQAWHGWMMSSGVSIATLIFFAALVLHVWVGVRDVLMDYIHPLALRVSALTGSPPLPKYQTPAATRPAVTINPQRMTRSRAQHSWRSQGRPWHLRSRPVVPGKSCVA